MRGRRLHGLAVAILIVAAGGCGDGGSAAPTAASPSVRSDASASATTELFPYDDEGAVVDAGTYRIPASAWSVAPFEVTFGEGWTVQYGHVFHRSSDAYEVEFYAVVPDEIASDACEGVEGGLMEIGPSVDDLATALLEQSGPKASRAVTTTLGGHRATRIDLAIPEGLELTACSFGEVGLQIWYARPADKYFVLLRDNPTSVYIVDVDGQRQVFIAGPVGPTTTERDARELQEVLDSIRFVP